MSWWFLEFVADCTSESEAAPWFTQPATHRVAGNCVESSTWLTSAVTTSNGIALARCHKQSGRLTSCISLFMLTWLQAGIYRRQLHHGTQSCLTRMADSEHILIYSPGPGAVFTGLNTSNTHSAETSSAARRVSWFSLPYNVSLIIPVGKLLQFKIKRCSSHQEDSYSATELLMVPDINHKLVALSENPDMLLLLETFINLSNCHYCKASFF